MDIDLWLKQESPDYKTGLDLYSKLPKHNKYFLQAMQKKHSPQNLVKLRYELKKLKKTSPIISPKNTDVNKSISIEYTPEKRQYKKVMISQLPVSLHPLFIEQKANFARACSLKIQLNSLENHEIEQKALSIILEIDALFEKIDSAWSIIDHYLEHREVLHIKIQDFSALSPVELLNKQGSLRSSITRQKKRYVALVQKRETTLLKSEKIPLDRKIAKSKQKLVQLESETQKIKEIIKK